MSSQEEAWLHYAYEHKLCPDCGIPLELTELTEDAKLPPCEQCVERQREFLEMMEEKEEEEKEEECICDENGEPPSWEDGIEMTCYCRECSEIRAEGERLYKLSLKGAK